MKHLQILIFLSLITFISSGQTSVSDTFLNKIKSIKVKKDDKEFLQAAKGAENYLNTLLTDSFYKQNIKINYKQTEKDSFQVFVHNLDDTKFLESHNYYNLHYYVTNKKDTLSYFVLLVDSIGTPTKFDNGFVYSSSPKLILAYNELWTNKFKIDYKKALEITRQQGFKRNPFFLYEIDNAGETFLWRTSNKQKDGKRRVFEINAVTGRTNEFYFPIMEE